MLGERIEDPAGLEGGPRGTEPGLGLLPLITRYQPQKRLSRVHARFGSLQTPWAALSDHEVNGYEIHLGDTNRSTSGSAQPIRPVLAAIPPSYPIGWQYGSVLALYLHGLFENASVLNALLGVASHRSGIDFDAMADHVEQSFIPEFLGSLAKPIRRP
jgi:adenosylcobyric acid synthase